MKAFLVTYRIGISSITLKPWQENVVREARRGSLVLDGHPVNHAVKFERALKDKFGPSARAAEVQHLVTEKILAHNAEGRGVRISLGVNGETIWSQIRALDGFT